MLSRVSSNSYNINAQVNNNLKTVVKRKPYIGWFAPVLAVAQERKVSFLCFMDVDPQSSDLTHLARHHNHLLEQNDMHKFKGLTIKIQH
jgi:hypothetical protein